MNIESSEGEKEKLIIHYLESQNYDYIKIKDETELDIIYNLYINDVFPTVDLKLLKPHMLRRIGVYYKINEDYENMKKFYLLGIEKGDIDSNFNIGVYYFSIENYSDAIKYLEVSFKNNDMDAALILGCIYLDILLSKYSTCAFELSYIENIDDMNHITNMKKYFNISFQKEIEIESIIKNVNLYLEEFYDAEYAQQNWEFLDEKNNKKYASVYSVCEI